MKVNLFMVKRGEIFRIKNPHEDKTAVKSHMHMTVSNNHQKKEFIIGTSRINYILMNNLNYVEANGSPLNVLTYFIVDRVYIAKSVNISRQSLTSPSRLASDEESKVLSKVVVSECQFIELDSTMLCSLNPIYITTN